MDRDQFVEQLVGAYRKFAEGILDEPGIRSVGEISLKIAEDMREHSLHLLQSRVELDAVRLREGDVASHCEEATASVLQSRSVGVATLFGTVKVPYRLLSCGACGDSYRPDDAVLGIPEEGRIAHDVAYCYAPIVAELPHRVASEVLLRLTGVDLSSHGATNLIHRMAEDVREWREKREEEQKEAAADAIENGARETVGLEVGIDGVMAFIDGQWREVKVATLVVRQTEVGSWDGQGVPPRGKIVAKRHVATQGDRTDLADRLLGAIHHAGWSELPITGVLGDGAVWIWTLADELFPGAPQRLDWWHLSEHFYEFANEQFSEKGRVSPKGWVQTMMDKLLNNRCGDVISSLKRMKPRSRSAREKLRELIVYVENNRKRMNYHTAWNNGGAIGSGSVEGACKHLIQTRFKRAGMRWKQQGFEDILELRIARVDGTLDEYWAERRGLEVAA